MKMNSTFSLLVALLGLLGLVSTSPIADRQPNGLAIPTYPGYDIVSSIPQVGGTMTHYVANHTTALRNRAVYGLDTRDTTSRLAPRCGSNAVSCDGKFPARQDECLTLLNNLRGNTGLVPSDGNAGICFASDGGHNCCIEWLEYNADKGGATWDNLLPAGFQALYVCPSPERVSAWTTDTLLGAACTSQCMSDRMGTCAQQVGAPWNPNA